MADRDRDPSGYAYPGIPERASRLRTTQRLNAQSLPPLPPQISEAIQQSFGTTAQDDSRLYDLELALREYLCNEASVIKRARHVLHAEGLLPPQKSSPADFDVAPSEWRSHKARAEVLANELKRVNGTNEKLTKSVALLEDDLRAHRRVNTALTSQSRSTAAELEETKARLEEIQSQLQDALASRDAHYTSLQEVEQSLVRVTADYQAADAAARSAAAQAENSARDVQALQASHASQQQDIDSLRAQVSSLQTEKEALNARVEAAEKAGGTSAADLSDAQRSAAFSNTSAADANTSSAMQTLMHEKTQLLAQSAMLEDTLSSFSNSAATALLEAEEAIAGVATAATAQRVPPAALVRQLAEVSRSVCAARERLLRRNAGAASPGHGAATRGKPVPAYRSQFAASEAREDGAERTSAAGVANAFRGTLRVGRADAGAAREAEEEEATQVMMHDRMETVYGATTLVGEKMHGAADTAHAAAAPVAVMERQMDSNAVHAAFRAKPGPQWGRSKARQGGGARVATDF